MLEEFTPCYALSHVRGEMQPIVMPSPLFGEGGLRSLPPYRPHRYSRAVMSVRTAEAGYQLFVAVSRPLKSPNVPILP